METPATAVAAVWVVMMRFVPWESALFGVLRVRGDWASLRFGLTLLRYGSSIDALIIDELNDSVPA